MIAMYASQGSLAVNGRSPNAVLQKKDLIRRTNVMVLFGPAYISNIMSLTMYNGNYYIWSDQPWGITVNCFQ